MADVLQEVRDLYSSWKKETPSDIHTLKQAGSNRQYFRVQGSQGSVIATYNPMNVPENNAFISFTQHFHARQLAVPEILYVEPDMKMYLQSDLGDRSLFDEIREHGYGDHTRDLFKRSLAQLAQLQILGGKNLDYNNCIATKSFDKQAIYSDLLYFLYYFVRAFELPYDKNALLNDFDLLSSYLMQEEAKHFMHRDCQSRNIMIHQDRVYFIDYQGGMQGALQYDVASMLWQARAALPYEWRDELAEYYFEKANHLSGERLNREHFLSSYDGFVLIRMMQTLGAYGFRGLFERKSHFISSIPFALRQLRWYLEHKKFPIRLPEMQKILWMLVDDDIIGKFETVQAGPDCKLRVIIRSFSYRNGIPETQHENGGGFVFDCRGIHNPGRYDEYKKLTGRDKDVQEFLQHRTEMPAFLQHIFGVVDLTVSDYIKRSFDSLEINFGCTGGQHRSVFAADSLARHLKEKFGLDAEVRHLVQDAKNWINETY